MVAVADSLPLAATAALDLHEGISTHPPRVRANGWWVDADSGEVLAPCECVRWPDSLRLRSSEGEYVKGRCKATNLCPYCQRLYVVETVEMLVLDALEYRPTVWVVLTAREHLTRRDTYRHLEKLRKAARKVWPGLEWFVQVEFQRRGALHLNLLTKGVPPADSEALLSVLSDRWCERVDARSVGQWAEPIEDARATTLYLSKMLAHGLKAEQAPPIGWKGHRTSQTRGYLVRPASVMRSEARASLRSKRALWRALSAGHEGNEAELVAQLELVSREGLDWSLVRVVEKVGTLVVSTVEVGSNTRQRVRVMA